MNYLLKKYRKFAFERDKFILENTDSIIETVEDCFLEFCDEYNLDVEVEKGHLVNDNYITTKMLPELLQMAKEYKKEEGIDIKECYRIVLISKEHRERNFFVQGYNAGKMPELGDKWRESINDDFSKCMERIKKLTNLSPNREIPNLRKSCWSISFYLI